MNIRGEAYRSGLAVAVAALILAIQPAAAAEEEDRRIDMDVPGMHRDKLGMDEHVAEPVVAPPCFDSNRAFYRHLGDLMSKPPLTEGQTCIVKIEQEHGYIREADFTECPAGATGPIGKMLFERQPFPVSADDECFEDDMELIFRGPQKYPE